MNRRAPLSSLAFGVEPGYLPYQLREARYQALGEDIARLAAQHWQATRCPLRLLDVGVGDGRSRRYVEAYPAARHIEWHGVDIFPRGREYVFKHREWRLYEMNLEQGLPQLSSDQFDVVICEQVLEHLHHPQFAASELIRVARPEGQLIIGVPIFPFGLHHLRKHLVPHLDRIFKKSYVRGHVQAFSLASFQRLLRASGPIECKSARGFRIVSGGILSGLENYRWWWRFNRWLGALAPALCIETQVTLVKTAASGGAAVRRAA